VTSAANQAEQQKQNDETKATDVDQCE
jgi:hypothetical protein